MAYDQSHLDAIDEALLNLAAGSAVQEIETLGKRVRYTPASINQLLALRSIVESRVLSASNSGGCFNKVAFYDPS